MDKIFKFNAFEQFLVQILLLAWSVVVIFPLYIAVTNSLKPSTAQVMATPFALPPAPAFGRVYLEGPAGVEVPAGAIFVTEGPEGEQQRYELVDTTTILDGERTRAEFRARFSGPEGDKRSGTRFSSIEQFNGATIEAQAFGRGVGLGSTWSWGNFSEAWTGAKFSRYFLNSVIISVSTIFLVILFGTMTSYVLARMSFFGSKFVFIAFMLGLVIPIRLALAPLYWIVQQLGLLDNLAAVILVLAAMTMPTAVFILTTFLKGVSRELEQAAEMDGASPFQIYRMVVLPLVRPAVATVALMAFIWAWNEYFLALIFITSPEKMPLTMGLNEFKTQFATQWHMMFAGILIMIIPTIVAFLLASKQFISGLAAGGVKE